MSILQYFDNIGSDLPIVKIDETIPPLPEICTQEQLDAALASHSREEPLGLQFFPESCVHTLAVGEQVYVINEFEGGGVTYPENDYTYVVPDAYNRACRKLLKAHGLTRPVESLQTQNNILGKGELPCPMPTSSLVPAFKANKELLQQQGNLEWYEKLRDAKFLAEGPEFSYDREKFMQILSDQAAGVQTEWAENATKYPSKMPVHLIPAGQVSGRFSTRDPNLQGLPKVLRPAFYIEPKSMCTLITADYKQIQPRILAALSGDAEWGRPFEEGIDFYKHCASAMFGKPIEAITDDERAVSKTISMGIVFGMGVDKMLEELTDRGITSIDKEQAEALRQAFLSKFSSLIEWRNNLPNSKYAGRIEGDSVHRTLRLPSDRQIVYDTAEFAMAPLCAHLAQGVEVEIVLNAILKFRHDMSEQGISARTALVLHDELLVSCRSEAAQTVGITLKNCMTEAFCEYPEMIPAENIVEISAPSVYWPDKSDNHTQE